MQPGDPLCFLRVPPGPLRLALRMRREELARPLPTDYNCQSQQFSKSARRKLACPYFMPVSRLENGSWPHPARLPLGSGWCGHCTAPGHEGEIPSQPVLEAFCNLGYASRCHWSPPERLWDAVRFAVCAPPIFAVRPDPTGGAVVPARILLLRYVCERSNRPVEHGDLEFDLSRATWLRRHQDVRIQKMAECFLESYLKKKA